MDDPVAIPEDGYYRVQVALNGYGSTPEEALKDLYRDAYSATLEDLRDIWQAIPNGHPAETLVEDLMARMER